LVRSLRLGGGISGGRGEGEKTEGLFAVVSCAST
jgi:hypothetical protein